VTTFSQSANSAKLIAVLNPGTPPRCESASRTVTAALPPCANSGQYCATGASRSALRRSINIRSDIAAAILPLEATGTIVSAAQGRAVSGQVGPAQMSTILRPASVTASDAPSSRPESKLAWNASANGPKPSSQTP